jgi:23S rRNA pseudouridine2605 synthase
MESSGLLLLTNDGDYAHRLTHPRYKKTKMYTIALDKPLNASDHQKIEQGIKLEDGVSSLRLKALTGGEYTWQVTMNEGRNRQIRRTFAALGYTVIKLHRTQFGEYSLGELASGVTIIV